jgi:alpha-tubulin suppressor-like RCC1 family protein
VTKLIAVPLLVLFVGAYGDDALPLVGTEAGNDIITVSDSAIVNDSANILGVIPVTSAFTVPVSPVAVSGGFSFGSITAGAHHSCGITTSGETRCWGADPNGELGVGYLTWFIAHPALVAGSPSFVAVNAGGSHTCALTAAGVAYCWGHNLRGELGTGSTGGVSAVPVAVATALTFSAIAAGGHHTCALTAAGAVYCWGDRVPLPMPVPGGLSFTKIMLGEIHTCGIASDGLAYCWGSNGYGQGGLGGLNGGINYADPTHTAIPLPVVGNYPFTALSGGEIHTCGITTDGAAYCWGDNTYGQVGKGTLGYAILTPAAVVGGLTLSAMEVGGHHSCAIAPTGDTYCWGNNDAEQLGDSIAGGRSPMPLKVAGGVQFVTLAGGGDHTCGLTASGAAYCWGSPALGALGNGTVP